MLQFTTVVLGLSLLLFGTPYVDADASCDLASSPSAVIPVSADQAYQRLNVYNLNNADKWQDKNTCVWNVKSVQGQNSIDLSRIILAPTDKFTIVSNGTNTLYEYKDKVVPGLIISSGDPLNITLVLDPKDKTFVRTFEVTFYSDSNFIAIGRDSGLLTLPLNIAPKDTFKLSWKGRLQPSGQYSDRLILLSFEQLGKNLANGIFFVDGKAYSSATLPPAVYISNSSGVQLELRNFPLSNDNQIVLRYYLVTASCTSQVVLDKKNNTAVLQYPSEEIRAKLSLAEMVCAQLFTINEPGWFFELKLGDITSLPNPADSITIFQVRGSKLDLSLNVVAPYLMYLNTVHSYFTTNQTLVIYDSPYGSAQKKDFKPPVMALTKSASYELSDTTPSVPVTIEPNTDKLIFTAYTLSPSKRVRVKFGDDFVKLDKKMVVSVYDTDMSGTPPIAVLNQTQSLPPAIDSNLPMIRIEFEGLQQKLTFTLQQVDAAHLHYITDVYNSTFDLNQTGLTEPCSWLVSQDQSAKQVVINPTFIEIPHDISLKLTKLSPDSTDTVTINGPMKQAYLPDINLSSQSAYLIQLTSTDPKKPSNEPLHVMFSKKPNLYQDQNIVTKDDTIKSPNYPGFYPLGLTQNWMFNKSVDSNKSIQALMTVHDLQLVDDHKLEIFGPNSLKYDSKTDLTRTPDAVITSAVVVTLTTPLNTTFPFKTTGHGFDLHFNEFSCGGLIDPAKDKTFSFDHTKADKTTTRCIWQVVSPTKSGYFNETFLRINVTLGSQLDKNKARIQILDAISLRPQETHFAKCRKFGHRNITTGVSADKLENYCPYPNKTVGFFEGSINQAIIVYDYGASFDTKTNFSIYFTVEAQACDPKITKYTINTCRSTDRCITPLMACDTVNDCGDGSDEMYCSGAVPPPVPPQPSVSGGGVNTWVVLFVLMPLGGLLGILGWIYLPDLIGRVRRGRYSEFRDLSEVS